MGILLVLLKSYFLFIHLIWMRIAELPLAVLLLFMGLAGLAVTGGVVIFGALATRFHVRWRRTTIVIGCVLLFGVLTAIVVYTPAAPWAPLLFAPPVVLGVHRVFVRWPRGEAAKRARQFAVPAFVGLLVFLFDLKLYALSAEVRGLERQFDTATFEIKAVKTATSAGPELDFGSISQSVIEHFLGFHASFHRVAPPIVLVRLTRGGVAPMAAFLAIADLTDPGLTVLITPERGPKRTISDFAQETGAIVAINGEAGDSPSLDAPLAEWTGNWVVKGKPILMEDSEDRPFMSFDVHNHGKYFPAKLVDRELTPEKWNTIWGRWDLLVNGQPGRTNGYIPRARTVMGLDATGNRLYLLEVDGDQAGYSVGLALDEVGALLGAFGATDAMACDEGGSSAMFVRKQDGIAGRPADGQERPIYTHFGLGYSPVTASGGQG